MYSINQLRDYSTLFTRSEIIRLLNNNFNSINLKIDRYPFGAKFKGSSYLNFYKSIYGLLKENYPNEYIFKNQFLNTWLIRELGNSKSIIYNELRLGKVIADLAMFNGISKVFEIKTPLDKEYRLSHQLESYKKIFNEVYIIIPEHLFEKYVGFDNTVGIITYESSKFSLKRGATMNYELDTDLLMEILHTNEYKLIVSEFYKKIPEMNSFNQFDLCKELISQIPSSDLNKLFLNVMKKRKINNVFFNKLNTEFNQICLSLNLDSNQKKILIQNLKTNTIN